MRDVLAQGEVKTGRQGRVSFYLDQSSIDLSLQAKLSWKGPHRHTQHCVFMGDSKSVTCQSEQPPYQLSPLQDPSQQIRKTTSKWDKHSSQKVRKGKAKQGRKRQQMSKQTRPGFKAHLLHLAVPLGKVSQSFWDSVSANSTIRQHTNKSLTSAIPKTYLRKKFISEIFSCVFY